MNTSELRKILIEDLTALRSGKITPNEARARAALVRQIIDTMKIELLHEAMNQPHPKAIPLTDEPEATVIGLRR
jgi:hypothetical protein